MTCLRHHRHSPAGLGSTVTIDLSPSAWYQPWYECVALLLKILSIRSQPCAHLCTLQTCSPAWPLCRTVLTSCATPSPRACRVLTPVLAGLPCQMDLRALEGAHCRSEAGQLQDRGGLPQTHGGPCCSEQGEHPEAEGCLRCQLPRQQDQAPSSRKPCCYSNPPWTPPRQSGQATASCKPCCKSNRLWKEARPHSCRYVLLGQVMCACCHNPCYSYTFHTLAHLAKPRSSCYGTHTCTTLQCCYRR